jgi:hypothetical protein
VKGYKSFEITGPRAQPVNGRTFFTREEKIMAQLITDRRDIDFVLYEGTNGIQAMDLLGRKLGMKGGVVFMNFLEEIQKITTGKMNAIEAGDAATVEIPEASFGG